MKKKTVTYSPTIPKTVSVRELQRTYRAVSEQLEQEGTLMVMNYSEPDMILLSKKEHQALLHKVKKLEKRIYDLEMADTMNAIEAFEEDKKAGRLIVGKTLADIISDEQS